MDPAPHLPNRKTMSLDSIGQWEHIASPILHILILRNVVDFCVNSNLQPSLKIFEQNNYLYVYIYILYTLQNVFIVY